MNDHIVSNKLGTGPGLGRSTGYKGTGFRMGYEAQARHTCSQSANVQGQVKLVRGATGLRSKFLQNLLSSSYLGSSQANDHIGMAKQLAH
jgi:hypothetical protein